MDTVEVEILFQVARQHLNPPYPPFFKGGNENRSGEISIRQLLAVPTYDDYQKAALNPTDFIIKISFQIVALLKTLFRCEYNSARL
jgi:hypothetical protein